MEISSVEILLVEDNPEDAELTMRAFKKNNVTNNILHLKDGEEAINYLFPENQPTNHPPKVILLDLKLPKVDGIQILKRLKTNEQTKMIPVVILTSSQEEKDIVESYKLGVNSYVTKPVEFEKFIDAVARLGLYWLILNQPPKL
ncbi:MAG: response regulator [Gammaproteobacteria bacterium]|nr:response regulator [Gammaproteobacteria bacterium]